MAQENFAAIGGHENWLFFAVDRNRALQREKSKGIRKKPRNEPNHFAPYYWAIELQESAWLI